MLLSSNKGEGLIEWRTSRVEVFEIRYFSVLNEYDVQEVFQTILPSN